MTFGVDFTIPGAGSHTDVDELLAFLVSERRLGYHKKFELPCALLSAKNVKRILGIHQITVEKQRV